MSPPQLLRAEDGALRVGKFFVTAVVAALLDQ
jgi:hypothetical protein